MTAARLKLSENELDQALAFVVDHGYSYHFPVPFELEALLHSWDHVRPALASVDLLSYTARKSLQLLAPKNKYTVRPIQLLDPVDLLCLTGLALRIAPILESVRIPRSEGVVHSFRFTQKPGGGLRLESDWDGWAKHIRRRLSRHKMVAKADIVDFFPRIYLHRLENSLNALSGVERETQAVMRLLQTWSRGTSYGVPVGPVACNILAEALLVEVDDFLRSQGLSFVRYIDDYVFFGTNEADCLRSLYLLGQRLDSTQGLSLNMAKTRLLSAEQFGSELAPPEDPTSALQSRIIEEVFGGNPYAEIDPAKLTKQQKDLISNLDSSRMLLLALEGDIIDPRAVKFVLNVLAGLRQPKHIEVVLQHLGRLQSVSEAVARFLNLVEFEHDVQRTDTAQKVLAYLRSGPFVPDYQSIWLIEPFARSGKWDHVNELRAIARDSRSRLVRRQAALALGHVGDRSALLDLKSSLGDAQDWEWRAILFACRSLPRDERNALWRSQALGGDWRPENLVAKATVEYARHQAAIS
ncbi:MAG: RNA-directed DNA polymerase [Dehalococcoidia bacterium]|jgi:hypothetical protein